MYYEINVAKNGKHYFATAERSLTEYEPAVACFKHFQKLFPESEGYDVRITRWMKSGSKVEIPE